MPDLGFSCAAHGKLLLTGEYAVLDGARALAVPTRQGQMLRVMPQAGMNILHWESIDHLGKTWFSADFSRYDFEILQYSDKPVALRLSQVLKACRHLNPEFCTSAPGFSAQLSSSFPLDWGLGSSSTLLAALAAWAKVDPFVLSAATFGGSGYDIACAFASGPIAYQLQQDLPAGRRETVQYRCPGQS